MMEKKLPLEGLKVLDFTIALAGPFTAWQLADMGAEVWKIERYGGGDQCRVWDPFLNDLGTMFVSYNKNKKSVEMNLAAPEGKAVIYEMAKKADVVIENFKSGSIDRLGLGYEKLKELNPKLVFISLSGFGASGPLMKLPCYDAIAEARSGFAASNGDPEGPPMKAGNCIGDTITGLYGLNAVLMALINARRTGQGCRIDMSMMDVGMQACEETIIDFSLHGRAQARFGDHDRFTAPYGMFEARDGWCVIIADTEERWQALCGALGHPEWLDDPRFADNAARVAHRDELAEAVTTATVRLRREEIESRLLAADVPASAVLSFIKAYTSGHAGQTELTQLVEQKKIGLMRFYSNPIHFDGETIPIRRGAPLLGEDTTDVLRDLGYTQSEIDKLYADGVVGASLI